MPVMFPDDIIRSIFSVLEFETLVDLLEKYQKKRPEWDEYRAKIPEEILQKWALVLKTCKQNGFLYSDVHEKKIRWYQIKTSARTRKNNDKCAVCGNDFIYGSCKGRVKVINGQKHFLKCFDEYTQEGRGC